jgi:SAM-dependent methyltransferase
MSGTYDPDLYDLSIPSDFGGDVDWYRRKARACGSPILELGAGTGRITIPLATDGHTVYALDANAAMLAKLRSKVTSLPPGAQERIVITTGDMRSLRLEQPFALAIIPFRAFLLQSDDRRPARVPRGCLRSSPAGRTAGVQCLPSVAGGHVAPRGRIHGSVALEGNALNA